MEKIKLMYAYPWRTFRGIWDNIKGFFRSIRNFYYRGRYGVAPGWDCWDLDSYMLQVFKNGLTEFRKNNWGYPAYLTSEEWDNVLEHMIELIEIIQTDSTESKKAEEIWAMQDNMSYAEWKDGKCSDLWWEAIQEWEEYRQDCMNELCDLMKEYFHHLWW